MLLARCYWSSLELARQHAIRSIAFPAISCGVFGYPLARAAAVAVGALSEFLAVDRTLERVLLVAYDVETERALKVALADL